MTYNTNPQSVPPAVAGLPPMTSTVMATSPPIPLTASLQPRYPAPQYGQQVQPTPMQPQPLYRGGYPPVGIMPPTPPAPHPSMPQKTQSARAMADSMPNAIEVNAYSCNLRCYGMMYVLAESQISGESIFFWSKYSTLMVSKLFKWLCLRSCLTGTLCHLVVAPNCAVDRFVEVNTMEWMWDDFGLEILARFLAL